MSRSFAFRYGQLLIPVCAVCLLLLICAAAARAAESEVMLVGTTVVRLGGKLPTTRSAPPVMRAVAEQWDSNSTAELFGAIPATQAAITGPSGAEADEWLDVPFGGSVRLSPDRSSFYYAGASPYQRGELGGSCDATQAAIVARAYVEAHGGMPSDAQLWSVRDVVAVGISLDSPGAGVLDKETKDRRVIGRYVEFRHECRGLEVDGPDGGDYIKVRVDTAKSVHAYGRKWTTTARTQGQDGAQAISPRSALAKCIARGGVGKSRLAGSVELKDATLVYVPTAPAERVAELRPAWRFVVDGGTGAQRLFVDAVEGVVLDGR